MYNQEVDYHNKTDSNSATKKCTDIEKSQVLRVVLVARKLNQRPGTNFKPQTAITKHRNQQKVTEQKAMNANGFGGGCLKIACVFSGFKKCSSDAERF